MKFQYVKIILIMLSLLFAGNVTADFLNSGSTDVSLPDEKGFLMASTTEGETACSAPVPVLFNAVPGDGQTILTWSDEHTGNPSVTGYNIYFDKDGKAEPVTSVWRQTRYSHKGLTNGQEYCFKITSLHTDCESGFSNVICAVPAADAQQR